MTIRSLSVWKNRVLNAFFFILLFAGCVERYASEPAIVVTGADLSPGWGIDACLTRHVAESEFSHYLELLPASGVRLLRERDVGVRQFDGSYQRDVRAKFLSEKNAGFPVVAFAHPADNLKIEQMGNALPENLFAVYEGGRVLAKDFVGLVDLWEMSGEPDVGYCTDLPERVVAYQKALYLGVKAGAAETGGRSDTRWKSGEREESLVASALNGHNPTARIPLVVMGALALPPGPWLERALRNGILDYTDAYNFHFYGHANDLAGVIAAHSRVAYRIERSGRRSLVPGGSRRELPLWITECGINAVAKDDFLNVDRRQLQAEFTVQTAKQALASSRLAVFMPFILVHDGDPYGLTLAANKPLPAWDAYARFTREHPWPRRPLANPPSEPNPIVLQWMPDNSTAQAHKVSGSYRFARAGPIRGQLKIYNFSDHPVRGELSVGKLRDITLTASFPKAIDVASQSVEAISMEFSRESGGRYLREECFVEFIDQSGKRSPVSFALETTPEEVAADFAHIPIALGPLGDGGSKHRFDPGDQVNTISGIWTGINELHVEHVVDEGDATAARLKVWSEKPRTDPLRARLAVARLPKGLPRTGFVRLQLSKPMDRDFKVCVDLVDRDGRRYCIWENFGVSYFHPLTTDVWLNLADFTPYFWGRSTADNTLHPERIEELQLRFYISKPNDPREILLSFMQRRES